jgi:hypothetical protein
MAGQAPSLGDPAVSRELLLLGVRLCEELMFSVHQASAPDFAAPPLVLRCSSGRAPKRPIGASPYAAAMEIADFSPSRDLPSLVQQFGTSKQAMARRLVKLDLVRNVA